MDEADLLCDRILVIDDGAIVARGTPDELKRKVAGDSVILTFERPESTMDVVDLASRLTEPPSPSSREPRSGSRCPTGPVPCPSCSGRWWSETSTPPGSRFGLIAEWRAGGVERMRVLYGAGVFCKESP